MVDTPPLKMMLIPDRSYCEKALAKALSRHIGYTTGAYSIFRIANIVLSFQREPSKYQFQLVEELKKQRLDSNPKLEEIYASEILNFAVALGLLERIQSHGQPKLTKFALSPVGLAYRAACELNLEPFKKFLLTGLVIENDADTYALLLEVLLSIQNITSPPDYRSFFKDWAIELREKRCEWINQAFSSTIIRKRLIENIRWLKLSRSKEVIQSDQIKDNFVRHHATPRKGWATELTHYGENGKQLTASGIDLVQKLRGTRNRFFWLGPPEDCQEIMRIPPAHRLTGPFAPSWNILRPIKLVENSESFKSIAEITASYMERAFPYICMVHANQAPFEAIRLYIYHKESELGLRVDADAIIRDILLKRSDMFAALSKRSGPLGYYQLRTKINKK